MTRLFAALCLLFCVSAGAEQITVAVASNFAQTAKVLKADFESFNNHRLRLAFGSSGKHYAQIKHGAPFHVFLAADQRRPQRLHHELDLAQAPYTYAFGKLVLWSASADRVDSAGQVLLSDKPTRLAIANPRFAPYGTAAMQVLENLNLAASYQQHLVMGENIAQTFQFVAKGNIPLGLVAYSQVIDNPEGSQWLVPQKLYDPIAQQAVLIKPSPAAQAFFQYLKSSRAKVIMQRFGYDTP